MDSSNAVPAISSGPQMQEEIRQHSAISKSKREPQIQLEDLVLTKHPFETLKFFTLAVWQQLKQFFIYAMTQGWLFLLISLLSTALGVTFLTVKGPHEKHVDELLRYIRFGLWWIGLGVASSIGLGSGLHTFVLYLGPHIAFYTIKATQCGRIDLKIAPYDTIQLSRAPSWIDKPCEEFGSPLFPRLPNSERFRTPLFSILPQVQLEAVLWGLGTALGELPPYFLSRAARLSGKNLEVLEELNATVDEGSGTLSVWLNRLKRWAFSKSQHLNFFTILVLASVPNPLFDLAGMLCGQFSISFWEFFTATLIGKAVFKTHIQTAFIILVCNNQLVEWVENEFIWILEHIPALSHILPHLMEKLHTAREKFYRPEIIPPNKAKGKRWNFSVALIWNTFVWLMLIGFFNQIITATAQSYVRERQKKEIGSLTSEQVSERHPERLDSSNGTEDLKSE
ncbi:hypothetical protein SUGI_0405650 [Cryptomeria japonica]|uniref:vacuole membrane protein KMS1 n=1 Tax=Cryptomeria japonica TaxID=3369 RepID=UPI002408ED68|nr:vacuole membrane protein KMS1 [Cryptomeria japonica]GLJ21744.1 hypothetical protein SUGI_0405650 [Cryptomeria japonica]